MGVERTGGLGGYRDVIYGDPNRHEIARQLFQGRPAGAEHGAGSGIGKPPRRQFQSMIGMPQHNRALWRESTTGTYEMPMDLMYGSLSYKGRPSFPGAMQNRFDQSSRRGGGGGFPGMPGMPGGGGGRGKIRTPGGAEFYGNEMIDVMFDDFRIKRQMDPVMADLFKTQMDYEVSKLKFGSDERINEANIAAALERAELEASLSREKMALEKELAGARNELERYNIEQQMARLEFQAGEQRVLQQKQHEADMAQLTLRESGETERARLPFEYKRERAEMFMPLIERLLGGGMGGGWGGGMPREVGPNIADNTPSFEGVLRRGVNDIVGNTMANRDAAMLGATASQTGPEGGVGGGTTANYLGPLAQHSAISGATGGINELLQNLLQHNLGQRQANAQTIGALAPYLT
ncbi:MAG: hypothetical protein Unbinned1606contig1000_57 [Prokaryotic dsDNA virus sp.]|mgnify:CR=1 FL=1|nr:MAG: hypothetical protein Unbinned1606contig1000_57 [Prokaryotic dsDNA virus sp.]|tara:strand:+ start:37308 stop:38528 length:1221 start_codon:yes stop_codon:yes gene_type:complete